jgi:hypothetical protein
MKKDRTKTGPTPKKNKWNDPAWLQSRIFKTRSAYPIGWSLEDAAIDSGLRRPK